MKASWALRRRPSRRVTTLLVGLALSVGIVAASAGPAAAAGPRMPQASGPWTSELQAGQELTSNQALEYGTLSLAMQSDGNIVLTDQTHNVWANGMVGYSGSHLVMQGDGNLVEYTPSGVAVWSSGTYGNPGAVALLTGADGFEVVGSTRLWGTPLPNTTFTTTTSGPGDVLFGGGQVGLYGSELVDFYGNYTLIESSGHLSLREKGVVRPLWTIGSYCAGTSDAVMQYDGNFVLYCNGVATWASGTTGYPASAGLYLHLLSNGELAISASYGNVIWAM